MGGPIPSMPHTPPWRAQSMDKVRLHAFLYKDRYMF